LPYFLLNFTFILIEFEKALKNEFEKLEGDCVLVTHGLAIDCISRFLTKDYEFFFIEVPFCSITTLEKTGDSFSWVKKADTSHL